MKGWAGQGRCEDPPSAPPFFFIFISFLPMLVSAVVSSNSNVFKFPACPVSTRVELCVELLVALCSGENDVDPNAHRFGTGRH